MGDLLFKEANTLFVGKEVARGQHGPYGGWDVWCGQRVGVELGTVTCQPDNSSFCSG
jgi:hypothetical protein